MAGLRATALQNWIKLAEAALGMGMSRPGALKRLKRHDQHLDGRLLRQNGTHWEVCAALLNEVDSVSYRDSTIDSLTRKVEQIDEKLSALRDAHSGHRRMVARSLKSSEKRLESHGEALSKIGVALSAIGGCIETNRNRA